MLHKHRHLIVVATLSLYVCECVCVCLLNFKHFVVSVLFESFSAQLVDNYFLAGLCRGIYGGVEE